MSEVLKDTFMQLKNTDKKYFENLVFQVFIILYLLTHQIYNLLKMHVGYIVLP